MRTETIPLEVLRAYGLANTYRATPLISGHINSTLLLTSEATPERFVAQRINTSVFQKPDVIAHNIERARSYLTHHHSEYIFPAPLRSLEGAPMVYDQNGHPWRITAYIPNTTTINEVRTVGEAYSAAHAFGLLTAKLVGCDIASFHDTIQHFHNLTLRLAEFDTAVTNANASRRDYASSDIHSYKHARVIATEFDALVSKNILQKRIHHHDTKINNVLFDTTSHLAIAVIDLDTLMPGYFTSDIGDMVRTFVGVYENERDLSKVTVRHDILNALTNGYLTAMDGVLSKEEISLVPFAGRFMTYMLGLRMLTDYLNNDRYFHVDYETQNLDRARNQFRLFELLSAL